jgi:hypothetical protein
MNGNNIDRIFEAAGGLITGKMKPDRNWQSLNESEIRKLEDNGCSSQDWSRVLLSSGSVLDRVMGCRFRGTVKLALNPTDKNEPLIQDSILHDVEVGPGCRIVNTGLLYNVILEEEVEIRNCGTITFTPGSSCGCGRELQLGVETGERSVPSFPLLDLELASLLSGGDGRGELLTGYRERLAQYLTEIIERGRGIIGEGACIQDTPTVSDSFIGPGCIISAATAVRDSTLLGDSLSVATVSDGALVRGSVLKWGSRVDSMAIVEDSIVGEASTVEKHGKLTSSFLGPNCVLGEGEITASLIGPFTAAHHQSLLIAVRWPEGRGNVGYGANVGSNHTSRLPDQELRPGEGVFFGLACSVKFPADYSLSPYSIIATGVTTLPQKVQFPFSLICHPFRSFPGIPPAFNQIVPGWVLSDNMFAVQRNDQKYRSRNRALHWEPEDSSIIREETVMMIMDALVRLDVEEVREFYTGRELKGLGKNVLTEEHRLKAIETYRFHMRLFALEHLDDEGSLEETDSLPAAIIRSEFPDKPSDDLLSIRAEMERQVEEAIESSRSKDDRRGAAIIDDYLQVRE